MSQPITLLAALAKALSDAAKVNQSVQAAPTAVLWTDAEQQWQPIIQKLRQTGSKILCLGDYQPDLHQGPAIWLKCAIAGTLPELALGNGPSLLYLPGISRTNLRAIESCSRELQPLAELQYRGVFWSQVNGRDWTVNAFLTSKNGGLGLDVAQDKATQEALLQVLTTGVLLDSSIETLQSRQINAEWLLNLLAPNPARDVLLWMNDPETAKKQWDDVRWQIFLKRCKQDFGFDPVADGLLSAAERLAKATGKWLAVWEAYQDAYASFPKVGEVLLKVQPPQLGLFDDLRVLQSYPQANEAGEASLRYKLSACAAMPPAQARSIILDLEAEHSVRRTWLWAKMGMASLAQALAYLADIAKLTHQLPVGDTPEQFAHAYRESDWQVDQAALLAQSAVLAKADIEAVNIVLQVIYKPWLHESAVRFQSAVKAKGVLGDPPDASVLKKPVKGRCFVFVDGLRYDVAIRLQTRLEALGRSTLQSRWTSLPSVTASGKAWCSPVASLITGGKADSDFQPHIAEDGKPLSAYNLRKLLQENGIQPLEKHETGYPSGQAWVECGDLDHYGHEHGTRLARDLDIQLYQIVERLSELAEAGWHQFQIVTDHGWLLVPGGLPKSEMAKHQTETRWGRCAIIKETAYGTDLTFSWDWYQDVQIAYAPGISSFVSGTEYAHGGLSVQECLVPMLTWEPQAATSIVNVTIKSVIWKRARCEVEVSPVILGLSADIRSKATVAKSSLVAKVKALENGKASLAVADEEHFGSAAVVVVLNANGDVVQKASTTIGG